MAIDRFGLHHVREKHYGGVDLDKMLYSESFQPYVFA